MSELESTWNQLEAGLNLGSGERHTLLVHRNYAEVIEIDELQFLPGAHVLLPRATPLPADPALQAISGLTIVAHALRYAPEHNDRVLLVAAHAEPPPGGDEAAARTLAGQRADNVLALLQGERNLWIAACQGCDRASLRVILKWAAAVHGIDCDPGDLDHPGKDDRKALDGLRRHYQRAETPPPPPVSDEEDYGAIFDLYEISLARMLEVERDAMPAQHAKLKLEMNEQIACGAAWPPPGGPEAEQLRSHSKQRVDLVFLQTSEPIPKLSGVDPPGAPIYADSHFVVLEFLAPEPPPVAHCVRMTGMFFDTDKAFLLPAAMPVMRNLVALHEKNAPKEILIVGHTDTTGQPAYNDKLSLERAKAVAAFLQADVESWYGWYGNGIAQAKRWGKREDLAMLGALPDGAQHLAAQKPIASYQTARGLEPDNTAGSDTRHQLITDYMALDGTTLPADVALTSHGCGESFPYVQSGDSKDEEKNRRVEFFMFQDAIDPPPSGDNSAPGSPEYDKWRQASITTHSYSAFGVTIDAIESPYFAPGHETVEITYSLSGVTLDDVSRLRLHVWSKKDKKLLGSVELARPYTGSMVWDGSYQRDGGGLGELIGLRHGDYTLALDVETSGADAAGSNEVDVSVLVAGLELRASDHASFHLTPPHQKAVVDFVKELGKGDKARVILDSSLFKLNSPEMNDQASFQAYETLWKDGPSIPFLAKLTIKTKSGDKLHVPDAVAGARLIFDFTLDDAAAFEASLSPRSPHAQAKAFLKTMAAYKEKASTPPGSSAHADLGGLRAAANKRWLADPRWNLSELAKRSWAARVECKHDAELDADCGVLFVGGRMAGDVHHVSVYYEAQDDLDVQEQKPFDDLDAARKSKPIALTTWRRVFVSGNNKSASKTDLDIPALGKEYKKAALIIEPMPGLAVKDITADWKKHYKSTVQNLGTSDEFVKAAAEDDPGAFPVRFVSFSDYQSNVAKGGLKAKVKQAKDETAYIKKCDQYAYVIYSTVAQKFPLAEGGLNFFKFGEDGDHNRWKSSFTAGVAPSITGYSSRTKSVFFVFEKGAATETLIHEVGHLVFLAHAPGHFNAGEQPDGYQLDAHDAKDVCIMSYAKKKNGLCGLCLIKLAGWQYLKVHKDGTIK